MISDIVNAISGVFAFLTTPVSWVIVQFHKVFGAIFGPDTGWAWGLSIVSLVVLIRICLIPLFVKQIKSTRNMQLLQPQMKAIQERYKNDKQRQSEEMMKLYKETGTNPLSSCLPILVQSPFFFALYHTLAGIAENKKIGVIDQSLLDSAQKAHIFGAPLAAKFMDTADEVAKMGATLMDVRVVTAVMIIMMSASQFYTQRQLMTKNVDLTVKTPFMQQQKMLMYVFPVIFLFMGINFPVGVLVYWLTTNVWTMGQQMYVISRNPTPGSKAQAKMLEGLQKHVVGHGATRTKRERNIVKAIVAKGRDRNEYERKFINGLTKASLAAQADGTVVAGTSTAVLDEDGTPSGAPKRQQPKRQSKSQRQSGPTAAKSDGTAQDSGKPSLEKKDAAESDAAAKPQNGQGAAKAKPAGGNQARSKAKSGQRKGGPQRPKSPSKK
ncbi:MULTISPECIES: membrane protein insertase YidC [unclassified Streptomyces]|uniref:membrane protein insertase YidC n=1 Tax=unclassified Streptomyces TaxID=2593676 RepID=UPI000DBAC88B|nr:MULTISPECIES: membrane protein insertase YidC [unclassified Streptomyces]MYT70179.1 membrane protein insertase YidC [Streptomyces sp. SID8367]RAJ88753.1 YidC/Oxa1 family membrane protein insertase [Streptomyces sp. PsTaAH-137]